MDGFTATGHIRAQEAERGTGERVPIVALTAHALETDRQKCLAAGMDDHLSKPFKDAELIAVLENWLVPDTSPQAQGVQSGENTTMTNENEAPAGEDISDSAIDFAVFDQVCSLYNENAEGFERIIELFLNSAAESVEKIRDGVGQGDLETVQRVAHSLKSSSASMGATTLSDLCRALESQTAESVEDIADTMAQLDAEVGRVKTALTGFGPESADRAAV
jgi:HPt (histidine-containing phosphotransfer) domain-containing protein